MRSVKSTQRNPVILPFRVDGTGTASLLEGTTDATLTDNGTGDYTLTFAQAFGRTPIVTATPVTTGIHIEIKAVSTTAVQFNTFAVADGTTATDADFHAIVVGLDSADVY
jgi:hypothetical protein